MKKKIMVLMAGVCVMALLAGCGSGSIFNKNIKIKKYKGLEINQKEAIKVTDADVEAAIQVELEYLGTEVEVKDRAAELGDTANIDFVGKMNGEAFDGGTGEGYDLELGSGTFIDGFEEGIVGKKIGEKFDLNLKFPEDYGNEMLNGQDVVFSVTLNSLKVLQLPELTDELLPEIGTTAKTVEEYKAMVKKELEQNNATSAKEELYDVAIAALVKQCEVKKYPQDMIIAVAKDFVFQESYGAIMAGKGIDEAIKEAYELTVEEKVKELVCEQLAIELVAEKEGLSISLEEYEKEVKDLAAQYGETDVDTFVKSFESVYGTGFIRRELMRAKVATFLIDNAK